MAKYKSEVVLTCNGKKVEDVLKTLRQMAADVKKEMDSLDPNVDASKIEALKKKFDLLNSAEASTIEANERLQHAIDNLASTSLQNLKKALGDGRRELQGLSEDQLAEADAIRKKMKIIGDEVRLLEGQYVKIEEGLKDINNQSNQWLDKAIKQQTELVNSLKKTDAEYAKQVQRLKQLRDEETRRAEVERAAEKDRAAIALKKQAREAEYRANTGDYAGLSQNEIEAGKKAMVDYQKTLEFGSQRWQEYGEAIGRAEEKLKSFNKTEEKGIDVDEVNRRLAKPWEYTEKQLLEARKFIKDLQDDVALGGKEWQQYGKNLEYVDQQIQRLKTSEQFNRTDLHDIARSGSTYSWNDETQSVNEQKASLKDMQEAKKALENMRLLSTDDNEIKGINEDLALLDKRMKDLVATEQQLAQNSRITGQAAQKVRDVLRDPGSATGNDLKSTIEALNKRILDLPSNSKGVTVLRKRVQELEKALKSAVMTEEELNDIIARSKTGKASIDELKRAYKSLEDELNRINTADDAFKTKQREMQQLKKRIDDVTASANKQSSSWATAAKNLVAYVGLFGAFNMLKEKITEAINGNLKYSDSLANIRKVSGLAKKDIAELSKELAKIDTRTSQEEMANIAYTGAKLGMGKYGTQSLVEFTEAANKVNVALKEDMGEDALKNLSKMVEVMGLIPKMGVEKSMMATSSALFKLASTSTASADQVVEFSKRLTGMSRTAGITTDQLLALGSASDSMMLMPEVASTAFSKLIAQLQRAPGAIEASLQIPKGTIDNLYSSGKAMEAIVLILEQMKKKGNMNALDDVFKDLGSDGARLISVMVTMSKNVDMLKSHLYESKTAFEEATAVTDEYNIQQETAQALLERANNIWEESFINPTQIQNVEWMARAWYNVSKALSENQVFMFALRNTMAALYAVCAGFVALLPTLATALLMGGFTYGISQWAVLVGNLKAKVEELKIAWAGLSSVVKATGWVGLAVTVASLIYNIYELAKASDVAAESQKKLSEYHAQGAANAAEETRKLDEYVRALESANTSQRTREQLIAQFNREYGSYLNKLGLEVNSVEDLKDAYARLNDELKKSTIARMRDQAYKDILDPLYAESHKQGVGIDQKLEKLGFGAINRRYMDNLYREIMEGEHAGEGVQVGNVASMANFIYNRSMRNKYGEQWNKKTNKVNVNNEGVVGGKGAKYNDEVNGVDLDDLRNDIVKYINQKVIESNRKSQIDKEFEQDLKDWTNEEVEVLGHLKDKPGKGKGGNGNPDKKEEQIAKDRANALIANIKAFYEEQERAYLEWVAKMNETEETVTKEEQARRISEFEENKKRALGTARQSIATLGTEWETYLKDELPKHMFNKDDEVSKQLVEAMGKSDIKGLHALFEKLSGDLSRENNRTLSENLGALLDQIFANGSKELREAAEKLLERQRELYAILNRDKFVDNVNQQTRGNLDKWQFLTPANGIDSNTEQGQRQLSQGFRELISKTRSQVHDLYEMLLVEDEKKFEDQMHAFLAAATKNFDFSNIKGKELHALLLMLIDDERNYEKALKDTDAAKDNRNKEAWGRDPKTIAENRAMDQGASVVAQQGIYGNLDFNSEGNKWEAQSVGNGIAQGLGMNTDFFNDPEIILDQLRLESKKRYYEEVADLYQKGQASEEAYRDAQKQLMEAQNTMAKDMAKNIAEQTGNLMSFLSPLQSFGESVGEAFATMHDDASAGRKAIKSALKDMTKSFAKATLDIIQQNLMRQLNNELTNDAMLLQDSVYAGSKQTIAALMYANLLMQQAAFNGETLTMEAALTKAQVALDGAKATAKGFAQLGPIAGPIAIAAMMAVIGAALSYALSMAFGGSDTAKGGDAKTANTKLVSGMLTYDQGNVQDLKPFFDKDGNMYWAEDNSDKANQGINLLTKPTATTINGQPSLVAENGPELVIGRETTAAMMQNNPALLRALYQYDKHHSGRTAYDRGNVSQMAMVSTPSPSTGEGQGRGSVTDVALLTAVNALIARLNEPIKASINMYGRGNLYDSMTKANQFMKGKS